MNPVPAVDAATVILVREGLDAEFPWELFLVRRPVRSDFAADVYVFPGGKVDPADRDPELTSLFDASLPENAPDGPAFRTAAVRELFEEAGVLLTANHDAPGPRGYEDFRRRLQSSDVDLKAIVSTLKTRIGVTALHPFAHWITPETMPRRYDTWFYLAHLPQEQSARHDLVETVHSVWISPRDALRRASLGAFPLVFVTQRLLERMVAYQSIDGLLESVSPGDLQPVMPRVVDRADGTVFLLPGDSGY